MTATDPIPEKLGRAEPSKRDGEFDPSDLAVVAAHLADNKKGERTHLVDVRGKRGYADYCVITPAPSERQSQARARSGQTKARPGSRSAWWSETGDSTSTRRSGPFTTPRPSCPPS